jgi:TrmH family RNA methyltransferase
MADAVLSARNPLVQQLRRLSRRRSSRLDEGRFVIDGPVLVADALASGIGIEAAFVETGAPAPVPALAGRLGAAGVRVHRVAPGVLAGAVDTVTPHGIAAVALRPARVTGAPLPAPAGSAARATAVPLVMVLAGVADPGNAGTLLRSAEAAGSTEVWSVAGSVDLYAPKVVRASAGALFHVPVRADIDADAAVGELRAAGIAVLGTRARDGVPYDRADLTGPSALVLGNEAHGLDGGWAAAVDRWLTIPMVGRAESLNVAMAGTLLSFEAARQRRGDE